MKNVTAAIIEEGNKILIAQRPASGHLGGKWEFPGGKAEPGENLADCLKREIQEELAVEIMVREPLLTIEHDYGERGIIRLHSFLCQIIGGTLKAHEHTVLRWVTLDDIKKYDFAPADIPIMERLLAKRKASE